MALGNMQCTFICIIPTFLFIFQMFGVLAMLVEYINKWDMIIISMLTSKKRHMYWKMKAKRLSQLRRKCWVSWFKQGRTDQWWDNLLSGELPNEEWHSNFRLPKDAFFKLEEELRPHISPDPASPNYRAVTAKKTTSNNTVLLQGHWVAPNDSKYLWYSRLYCLQNDLWGMQGN